MKKEMINFDSTSWESIRETIDTINEVGEMQVGKTADGEDIHFNVAKYGDEDCLVTNVFQSNGCWVRQNIYHPSDYTVEELYIRR